METSFTCVNPEVSFGTLSDIVGMMAGRTVAAFYGEPGAGKTTLIKALCKHIGVTDNVTSPTFALVNEYETASGEVIYHFDFYRIADISEVYDMGYEEYFYGGNLCLIEWPELIEPLLPDDALRFKIEVMPDGSRLITKFDKDFVSESESPPERKENAAA